MNKDLLCEAFCGELEVHEVPAGFAVKTAFRSADGDAVGFYVVRHPSNKDLARLEDSGLTIPMLEAHGVNLETGTRSQAFKQLLSEHSAHYDDDTCELHSEYVTDEDLPSAAMSFISLMLRVRDLELLTADFVASTFRQDAEQELRDYFKGKATLDFNTAVETLPDFVPDVTITPLVGGGRLALYLATSEQRVDEAVMLWMEREWHKRNFEVAILLESEKPAKIGGRSLRRAMNRVHVASFRGDERGAMQRIARYSGMDGAPWVQ